MNSCQLAYLTLLHLLIALGMAPSLSAQKQRDTSVVQRFDTKLTLKPLFDNYIDIFSVKQGTQRLNLRPNNRYRLRLFANYRFLSVSFGFSPRFLPGNNDADRKGESELFLLNTNLQLERWVQSFAFRYSKGFYLENTSEFDPRWRAGQDPYLQFPDLLLVSLEGYTAYKVNPNFSLRALTTQTERQLQSAGSFLPALYYRYFLLDDQVLLDGSNSSQKSNNFELILESAYYYTHVWQQRFYLSGGLTLGAGFIHADLQTRLPEGSVRSQSWNPVGRTQVQLGLGYQNQRFFAGLEGSGRWDHYPEGEGQVVVDNLVFNYQIFVGYRFPAPGFLQRTVAKLPSFP